MIPDSILEKLASSHRALKGEELQLGVYYKNTLIGLCHALEDSILVADSAPLTIAAFQQGKWYLQEAERYGAIARKADRIAILARSDSGFAEHPTSNLANVSLVSLDPSDPVAQEWHLVILAPTYTVMVLCQELSDADYGPDGPPENDLERKFYGLWTFEPKLVLEAIRLLVDRIGRYDSALQKEWGDRLETYRQDEDKLSPPPEFVTDVAARVVKYLEETECGGEICLGSNLVSNEMQAFLRLAQLVDRADPQNPMAASEVAALVEMMGQLLDLPSWQIKRSRLAALLHRLAPAAIVPAVTDGPCCPLNRGTQALRTMPRLRAIAEIIDRQGEWWNGSGRPGGSAGTDIPLESRLLGLLSHFQTRSRYWRASETARGNGDGTSDAECLTRALAECQEQAGERWDPDLVNTLNLLVLGLQQGLSNLSLAPPKVSAGMWLLDGRAPERKAAIARSQEIR